MPEPPDRQRIRSELDSLTRSRHGANRRETLHERCPYLCGLDVVERSTPPDVAPGFVAVRLLERALERIDGEPARALTAMLALGEGQSVNPQSDRDTRARELLGRENKATFKGYRPALIDLLADRVYDLAVWPEELRLPFDPFTQLAQRRETVVAEERNHLQKFQHGLPRLTLRGATLLPGSSLSLLLDPPIDECLADWLHDPRSNLMVVLAGFGSGKTTALLDLVDDASHRSGARRPIFLRYRDLVAATVGGISPTEALAKLILPDIDPGAAQDFLTGHLSQLVFVVDGFDATVLASGRYSAAPDLREFGALITSETKLLFATDRSFNRNDELIAQLSDADGARKFLGVVEPRLVELLSCHQHDIVAALSESLGPLILPRLVRYLERLLASGVSALRRPVFLQMLVGVATKAVTVDRGSTESPDTRTSALTLIDLLDKYVEVALSRDWDRNTSYIPPQHKRTILRELAFDMFKRHVGLLDVPVDDGRLEAQVMPVVTQNKATLGLPANHSFESYNWVSDFRIANHLLTAREGPGGRQLSDNEVGFINDALLDYFVAESILTRLRQARSIGIDDQLFDQAALSSLVLYVLKQRMNDDIANQIKTLAVRPGFGHVDRMLMIYLLEDDPDILRVIKGAPTEYHSFLYSVERRYSTVLARVVKYQLVLLEDDRQVYGRALDFIDWAGRATEVHREPEGEMPAFREPIEPFLFGRLHNPALIAALPITIFRLGQFGSKAAAEELRSLRVGRFNSGPVAGVVDHAVGRIEARQKEFAP